MLQGLGVSPGTGPDCPLGRTRLSPDFHPSASTPGASPCAPPVIAASVRSSREGWWPRFVFNRHHWVHFNLVHCHRNLVTSHLHHDAVWRSGLAEYAAFKGSRRLFRHVLRGAQALNPSQRKYFSAQFSQPFQSDYPAHSRVPKISLPFFRNMCFAPRIPPRQEGRSRSS